MTGIPGYNRDAFNKEAAKLEAAGHVVLNPATLPIGLTKPQYMDICFAMLRACDGIHMLHGWGKSDGALAELAYAESLTMGVSYQVGGKA